MSDRWKDVVLLVGLAMSAGIVWPVERQLDSVRITSAAAITLKNPGPRQSNYVDFCVNIPSGTSCGKEWPRIRNSRSPLIPGGLKSNAR